MIADHWLEINLPLARPYPKQDSATRAWTTPALFIKFFPYALQARAATEAEVSSAGLHEAIIPSLLMSGVDDGVILVYPRVSGEALASPEARQRFYDQPAELKHRLLARLFDAYAAIADAGWTLVDLYEGNLIFDAQNELLWCYDWDLSVKAPGFALPTERNYGSSRLMAPEEFIEGAWIDQRTTVFNLGRMAQLALGRLPSLERATEPDPAARFDSIATFAAAFQRESPG